MLTDNVNPKQKLANGTNKNTYLHSLTWKNYTLPTHLPAGIETEVDPPHSVNIQITSDTKKDNIVPILGKHKTVYIGKNKRPIHFKHHHIELGFSYTYWKVQGATLDAIILVLNKKPFKPNISLRSFYVGISRVNNRNDIRLWPIDIDKKSCKDLQDCVKNYNDKGELPV